MDSSAAGGLPSIPTPGGPSEPSWSTDQVWRPSAQPEARLTITWSSTEQATSSQPVESRRRSASSTNRSVRFARTRVQPSGRAAQTRGDSATSSRAPVGASPSSEWSAAGVLPRTATQESEKPIRSVGDELRQDDGHVVDSAVGVGSVDQLLGGGVQSGGLLEDRLHHLVGDHAGEAVGAEHEDVAGLRLEGTDLHVDDLLLPQRAQDDVLLRERLRLLRGDLAQPEVLLDQRVVDGHALQAGVAA